VALTSVLTLVLLLSTLHVGPLAAQDLATADAAFMQQRFPDAQRAYRAVIAHGTLADRKKAAVAVAGIDWMVDDDTTLTMRELRPFARISPALTMMSRARLNARNVTGARLAARGAIASAHDADERREAAVALGDAALFPYEQSCLDSASSRPNARDAAAVREAIARLRAEVTAEPGHYDVSERLMRLAAIAREWPALALGWRSFYAVGSRVPGGPLVRAEDELRSMESGAATEQATHAFAALVDSKLFEPAALIATCGAAAPRSANGATNEIIAYARFLREAKRVTNAYYRDVARARADTLAWKAKLDSAGRRLWPRLDWRGAAPAYALDSLASQLDQRFALVVNLGTTGAVLDLHAGHRISDENREVLQYGKSAHIRFSVLDGMISDGYQSWAWDGRAAHGGWATDAVIIQVRERYADGPLSAWHEISDLAIVARDAKTLARDSAADISRARSTEVQYFPSVRARLLRDARLALRGSLRRTGLTRRDLQSAFVRAYGSEIDESSIFAHEGRHAIDRTIHIADSSAKNLEYQAKLSEIAFAPSAKLALSGILIGNTGDETPHGIADAKLLGGMLDWMRHHGFSDGAGAAPLPIQIPLLTDDQLRAAVRSLDPLAADSSAVSAKP
jgi:hypothetical protein